MIRRPQKNRADKQSPFPSIWNHYTRRHIFLQAGNFTF